MWVILRKLIITVGIPTLLLWAMAAAAHHSAAQFDLAKRVTIEGVVKVFNIRNPHTMAVIEVTDAKGVRDVEYEGHSASHFYRAGYKRGMVHVGDRIAILVSPRRDGGDGGFIHAFTVNDNTVGFGGQAPDTGERAGQE